MGRSLCSRARARALRGISRSSQGTCESQAPEPALTSRAPGGRVGAGRGWWGEDTLARRRQSVAGVAGERKNRFDTK